MPLDFRRFAPTGPRTPRETATLCNQIGENTATQIAAMEARLDVLETLIVELRFAAQAAMTLATPVAGPDITATFQPITFFDTITYERGVTVNTTTGEFTFNLEGDWAIWYRYNINHAGSGARRTFQLRTFEVTGGTPGGADNQFIGSNQEDTADVFVAPLAIVSAQVGDIFRIEIGNASANITGVTWNSSTLLIMFVGELGSLT